MKNAAIVTCLLVAAAPLLAQGAYPMTTIAELGTQVG